MSPVRSSFTLITRLRISHEDIAVVLVYKTRTVTLFPYIERFKLIRDDSQSQINSRVFRIAVFDFHFCTVRFREWQNQSKMRCNLFNCVSFGSIAPARIILLKVFGLLRQHWIRITVFITFLICVWPSRYAPHYPYVASEDIYDELVEKTTQNVSQQLAGKLSCDYRDVISENHYMYREPYISTLLDGSDIRLGGEWMPSTCAPKFSTAVIVVYRQREKQLQAFLTYIHNFLRKQQIHYRIFVIEQYDQKPFNRAMLFNIGSIYAAQLNFPCLILHDVDLMPMNLGNLYVCSKRPRHMCSSLDKFRFNLLYHGLFGGVVSIETKVFQFINGMSNMVNFSIICYII